MMWIDGHFFFIHIKCVIKQNYIVHLTFESYHIHIINNNTHNLNLFFCFFFSFHPVFYLNICVLITTTTTILLFYFLWWWLLLLLSSSSVFSYNSTSCYKKKKTLVEFGHCFSGFNTHIIQFFLFIFIDITTTTTIATTTIIIYLNNNKVTSCLVSQ